MEHAGAQVDMNRLMNMREQLASDANHAQETAWQYAGERVNLQSPKQLQKILFEDMGLKPTKKTKTGFVYYECGLLCRCCVIVRMVMIGLVSFLMRCCCIVRRISLSRLCRR